jgi:thioredoxin-dependent peroxiredoxin
VILGVSFDSVEDNRAFAEKFSFPFLLLSDTEREIGLAYGACSSRDAPAARRISYVIGPDGKVQHVWGKVDVKAHVADVLATLE